MDQNLLILTSNLKEGTFAQFEPRTCQHSPDPKNSFPSSMFMGVLAKPSTGHSSSLDFCLVRLSLKSEVSENMNKRKGN